MPFDDEEDSFDRTISGRRAVTAPGTVAVPDQRAVDRRQSRARTLLISVIVIAILYFSRPVVVPMALAVLFAFLLTPIVATLERTFIRRTGGMDVADSLRQLDPSIR